MTIASRQTCRGHDWIRPNKFRPNQSIHKRVMAFPTFSNMATVAILNFKNFNIWSWDANNCWIFNAPLLGNGRCHGNRIMADMSYHPSFIPIPPLVGELQHFQHFPIWWPSAILNFKNFNIWSRDCYCSRNLLLYTKFHQNCFTRSASRCP